MKVDGKISNSLFTHSRTSIGKLRAYPFVMLRDKMVYQYRLIIRFNLTAVFFKANYVLQVLEA